jgi:4-amino-4-deoxy-L-arabinose transferase-like glycosyltransferase
MRKIPIQKIILIAILLVAAFLRLWKLGKVPVAMFGDEMDVGYHAYSILKTGRDYSGNFLPIHFQSLAEWRTPLYLYSTVPTVAIFGISPWGVRLPAAIFGILGVIALYLLISEIVNRQLAIVASFLLAVSPWYIQYSRAGFEATQLIFFLLIGFYFFFKSFLRKDDTKRGKYLWMAAASFCITPWIYSTAKFFTPFLLLFIFIVWRKEIFNLPKKYIIYAAVALFMVGSPIAFSTFFSGGTQRFGYISIFTDPTTEPEVGSARLRDARMRGEVGSGLRPTIVDRVIHNKFTFWASNIIPNYLSAFSTNFLFIKGDPNLRHSIDNMGELYRVEFIPLIIGIIFFFVSKIDKKIRWLMIFWIFFGVVPAAITRDGGNHATRLILILPPLIFLVACGLYESFLRFKGRSRLIISALYLVFFGVNFVGYQHNFWIHNPWDSERWWHAGWQEAIQTIKKIDKDYDKVVISMSGEPAWIFFAGWYQYPPQLWHQGYPFKKTTLAGFGEISYIDKFYFGSVGEEGIYGLGKYIDTKTLYLANAKEIGANLIMEPGRTPPDLRLIKAISYPSGEPAFYLFTKKGD